VTLSIVLQGLKWGRRTNPLRGRVRVAAEVL
jgi:hypothetical protein